MNIRASAARVINHIVEQGRSLTDALADVSKNISDSRDRALLQAICYGVCRWYFRLDAIANVLLEKPLKAKDSDIHALILVGLYQLIEMRIPDYAAVTETVAAVNTLKKSWAKGLLNGVLRQYQRRANEFKKMHPSHPEWLLHKLKKAYPQDWEQIVEANNQHPPLALRVNQQRISRVDYLKKLSVMGVKADLIPETLSGLVLAEPMDVQQLPGFWEGEVSVQDGAAQWAAEWLALEPHQRVLDACAAPGGKTAHILELQPTVDCIAVDQDGHRLLSVKENLQRLRLSAKCVTADVSNTSAWWDGILFDRILLDAPCSASGVIRRHPDIKLLRRETDIAKLAETQLHLLNVVWELLKPGGKLLYVTCSIFSEENSEVIQQFLALHKEATEEKSKQILPGMQGMDGFYFARLQK